MPFSLSLLNYSPHDSDLHMNLVMFLLIITFYFNDLLAGVKDEAPHLVNPLVESFVARHATPSASVSTTV